MSATLWCQTQDSWQLVVGSEQCRNALRAILIIVAERHLNR